MRLNHNYVLLKRLFASQPTPCVTECIVRVPGHDPLIFSFLSSLILFDWVGVVWPQLSKVLKLVRWAGSVPFLPVSVQRQVVCFLLRPVFMFSSQGRTCK